LSFENLKPKSFKIHLKHTGIKIKISIRFSFLIGVACPIESCMNIGGYFVLNDHQSIKGLYYFYELRYYSFLVYVLALSSSLSSYN